VKVLDFGLAKAVDPTAGSSATAMNSPSAPLMVRAASRYPERKVPVAYFGHQTAASSPISRVEN
jgi:hypothetical protein